MQIDVELGLRSYPIHIQRGGLDGLGAAVLAAFSPGPVVVVTNPTVAQLYEEAACTSLREAGFTPEVFVIPDGEQFKTVAVWQDLVERILAWGMSRTTPVLALGGGVVGDIAGFAAASVMRGAPLIQVPTTLLAMVDSAVGGKTGVNSPRGKNLIGAFHQPRLVFAAMETLETLASEEVRCGLGEVLKHGVIRDPVLFALCRDKAGAIRAGDPDLMMELVLRSCRVKADVVAQDEREGGLRSILNFGHTVGHAIETGLGHGTLRHGECVALGMIAEAEWARQRGDCTRETTKQIIETTLGLGLAAALPADKLDSESMMAAARTDKKLSRGKLRTAVLVDIGTVRLEQVGQEEIRSMLEGIPWTTEA